MSSAFYDTLHASKFLSLKKVYFRYNFTKTLISLKKAKKQVTFSFIVFQSLQEANLKMIVPLIGAPISDESDWSVIISLEFCNQKFVHCVTHGKSHSFCSPTIVTSIANWNFIFLQEMYHLFV